MGGTFEEQMVDLYKEATKVVGEVINVPTGGNNRNGRSTRSTRTTGGTSNVMHRPSMTRAETITYQREHQAAQAALTAAGGYGSDRERHWVESMQRQQAALAAAGAGGGGGGGGGGGVLGSNGSTLDPKFAAAAIGGILLLLFWMKRRRKAA